MMTTWMVPPCFAYPRGTGVKPPAAATAYAASSSIGDNHVQPQSVPRQPFDASLSQPSLVEVHTKAASRGKQQAISQDPCARDPIIVPSAIV